MIMIPMDVMLHDDAAAAARYTQLSSKKLKWLETVFKQSSKHLISLETLLRWLETVRRWLETVLKWLETVLNMDIKKYRLDF